MNTYAAATRQRVHAARGSGAVRQIAVRRWVGPDGQARDFLSGEEIDNLCIAKGTLNPTERAIIEEHVALTLRMLNALPWPKSLHNVPEYAGSHHETLDGGGYHRGLREQDLPIQARIICLADVFEALTARDRPYKPGKPLSEVLEHPRPDGAGPSDRSRFVRGLHSRGRLAELCPTIPATGTDRYGGSQPDSGIYPLNTVRIDDLAKPLTRDPTTADAQEPGDRPSQADRTAQHH